MKLLKMDDRQTKRVADTVTINLPCSLTLPLSHSNLISISPSFSSSSSSPSNLTST